MYGRENGLVGAAAVYDDESCCHVVLDVMVDASNDRA